MNILQTPLGTYRESALAHWAAIWLSPVLNQINNQNDDYETERIRRNTRLLR